MDDRTLEEKLADVFNRGAYQLHFFDFLDLNIRKGEFSMFMFPVKVKGTNERIYREVRKRAVRLFRMIRDKRLNGFYFTPRTLLWAWEQLDWPESSISSKEFRKQPWAAEIVERHSRERESRFHEVVV